MMVIPAGGQASSARGDSTTSCLASFRDPAGTCRVFSNRVLRSLRPEDATQLESFLATHSAQQFCQRRWLVQTRRLTPEEVAEFEKVSGAGSGDPSQFVLFEHQRVPFISYPCEWAPEMLWEAANLTLDLAIGSLSEGFGLKDATPYNVLFLGPNPVFIDLPSFERRRPGDPVWNPNAQFVRTFLLPLLANSRWKLSLRDIFLAHRDGLEPENVYPLGGLLERFSPQVLSLVSIPTWLRGRANAEGERLYQTQLLNDHEKATFILNSVLRRLQRSLLALKPRDGQNSDWSQYMSTHSYSQEAFDSKEKFVREFLAEFKPKQVLDLGANTGHFSFLAANAGAEVVAVEVDPACVGKIWRRARAEQCSVLPLVVDIARPTPGLGWQNQECPSFLERAKGSFDAVLMLAVVHHLLVTERVPLTEIMRLASELTSSLLIIEFVGAEDEMFRRLTRGREHLHSEFNVMEFEKACAKHFEIVRMLPLPGTARRVYGLKRKQQN